MDSNLKEQKKIFFAYEGARNDKPKDNVEAINRAIEDFNKYQKKYFAKSWEDCKTSGEKINQEVIREIDECSVFACDLTWLNHNVLFELGYAIAKNKDIFILLNESISGSKELYHKFILKGNRYTSFINHNDILPSMKESNFKTEILKTLVNLEHLDFDSRHLFHIQSQLRNQTALDLNEFVDNYKRENKIVMDNDSAGEVEYQPLHFYCSKLIESKMVLINFLGEGIVNSELINAQNSFFAGLAKGLNKKLLMIAPAKYPAPLDYYDLLRLYKNSSNCIEIVEDWLNENKNTLSPFAALCSEDKIANNSELNLLKLGIGELAAEEEKEDLLTYFIETNAYNKALNNSNSILIGRKGAGKTAIYIKLLNEFMEDEQNYIINLKPESDEILDDIKISDLIKAVDGSKKSFFFNIWKQVIYSKLLLEIYENDIKTKPEFALSELENSICRFVSEHKDFLGLNFFNVLTQINSNLNSASRMNDPNIIQAFHTTYLNPMIKLLSTYLKGQKYKKIIILADNLDRAWNIEHNLEIQSDMLLSLFEIDTKLEKELMIDETSKIAYKKIIFLREDIFNFVIKRVTDRDKFSTSTDIINWEEYPDLLKKLLEERFKFHLENYNDDEIRKIWDDLFDINEDPFEVLKDSILIRPRDFIYFVRELFGSAINNGHTKVTIVDFRSAAKIYSNYLKHNLITELFAEFSNIEDILDYIGSNQDESMSYNELFMLIDEFYSDKILSRKLLEALLKKGYILAFKAIPGEPISKIEQLNSRDIDKEFISFVTRKKYLDLRIKRLEIKGSAVSCP